MSRNIRHAMVARAVLNNLLTPKFSLVGSGEACPTFGHANAIFSVFIDRT